MEVQEITFLVNVVIVEGHMICSNCFEAEFKTVKKPYEIFINDEKQIIEDVEREECPLCGYSIFTHSQAIYLDKKRVIEEFGSKPLLTPFQLKMLRSILDLTLDQISEMLHIGRNTYGRWERGEVDITPSMNLLVHNFIDKMPIAKVNLIESFMDKEILSVKRKILSLNDKISLGKYLNEFFTLTGILPAIISQQVEISGDILRKIETHSIDIPSLNLDRVYSIAKFLKLSFSELAKMLRCSFEVFHSKDMVSFMHTRTVDTKSTLSKDEEDSIADIMEALTLNEEIGSKNSDISVIEEYIEQVQKIYYANAELEEV
jgi:transcriptional regulator with XRE-family HTH domain